MRFEELPHWNDGQFLQPHHFQYQQRILFEYIRLNRRFSMPYQYGLVDFEIDFEALKEARVVVKRFSAIMDNGVELSMPGNCIIKPLDLSAALKNNPSKLTVYTAVPVWSEFESNLADENNPSGKKIYLSKQKKALDENTGDNEITLITRGINVRLVTDEDDNKDMRLLPVLKLDIGSSGTSQRVIKIDEKYIPPFLILSADDPLFNMIMELITDIRRCRDKLRISLDVIRPSIEDESSARVNILSEIRSSMRLRALTHGYTRLSALMMDGSITPFDLYIELASFLSDLMGINPSNEIIEIKRYDHDDRLPVFMELLKDIRSFIRSDGGAGYIRLNFAPQENSEYLFTPIKPKDIAEESEIYLTVKTSADTSMVIRALEQGDNFRLIYPSAKHLRIRGIKLSEIRYPPRFLPIIEWVLWFKLDIVESAKVWQEICAEEAMIIDCARDIFPDLEASLFITVVN
ncbi:MAG: type VI secretion system baseplate subunit TssK [Spirochaetaceae bacterium]|jgi:type VI secretion system ImpJ/VasE family protein|nr:type VI secretion system baseplate subunit TssK [Spirochaetaceae bacterium]